MPPGTMPASAVTTEQNIVPPSILRSGERVLIETRPSFWYFFSIAALIWFIIGVLILAIVPKPFMVYVFIIIFLLPLLINVLRSIFYYRATYYALTDARIIMNHKTGFFGYQLEDYNITRSFGYTDVNTIRIMGVDIIQNFKGRLFGYSENLIFKTTRSPIYWKGVPNGMYLRKAVEDVVGQIQTSQHVSMTGTDAFTRLAADMYAQQHVAQAQQLASAMGGQLPMMQGAGGGAAALPASNRLCPRCNTPVPANMKFCGNCGGPV
jgi:hypothetical protein